MRRLGDDGDKSDADDHDYLCVIYIKQRMRGI